MFQHLTSIWEDRDSGSDFQLRDIEGFPFEDWSNLKDSYRQAELWFTGNKLEGRNKNDTELYPLKVNPIIGTCLKHAYMLFGEPQDDGRPQVYPKLTGDDEELVKHAEDILNQVWEQSSARASLIESGILSQIYGGAVLKLNWNGYDVDPLNPLNQLRVETLPATQFYGIPYPGDYYRMKKAWIVKKIDDAQADVLGYNAVENADNWFVEYWDEKIYWQKINGKTLNKKVGNKTFPLAGENEFGFVPIWYVPHLRIGTFFGINTFDNVLGLVKEINLRYADYGDAVNDDSHSNLAGRNISGSPKIKQIGSGLQYIDLGSAHNLTGNEPEPDLFEVSKTNKASAAMSTLADVLYDQYRRDASIPAVADGEDEGSQRSGLTIAMRFYPMTSHIGIERYFWTPALNKINQAILRVLKLKEKGDITDEHLKLRIKQKWAPLLPRDREADVQEWVSRASNDIGAIETLLEQTGDVEDIPREMERILAWKKAIAQIEGDIKEKIALATAEANAARFEQSQNQNSDTKPKSDQSKKETKPKESAKK